MKTEIKDSEIIDLYEDMVMSLEKELTDVIRVIKLMQETKISLETKISRLYMLRREL